MVDQNFTMHRNALDHRRFECFTISEVPHESK
jgi:hypothetical protein